MYSRVLVQMKVPVEPCLDWPLRRSVNHTLPIMKLVFVTLPSISCLGFQEIFFITQIIHITSNSFTNECKLN